MDLVQEVHLTSEPSRARYKCLLASKMVLLLKVFLLPKTQKQDCKGWDF